MQKERKCQDMSEAYSVADQLEQEGFSTCVIPVSKREYIVTAWKTN